MRACSVGGTKWWEVSDVVNLDRYPKWEKMVLKHIHSVIAIIQPLGRLIRFNGSYLKIHELHIARGLPPVQWIIMLLTGY